MTITLVRFADAEILASRNHDIIVFVPSSGDCFRFDDLDWTDGATKGQKEELLKKYGHDGMDAHFSFIWIHDIPE